MLTSHLFFTLSFQYNIVATPDFTMGAMENKGLNIFNSKYVLCDEATATDSAILGVSRVVAHECVRGKHAHLNSRA